MNRLILIVLLIGSLPSWAQSYFQQQVDYSINVRLDDELHVLHGAISFEYKNNSSDTLNELFIHLWPNAYQGDHTALGKQLLENRNTDLHFYPEYRGSIDSLSFQINGVEHEYKEYQENPDIAVIPLQSPLFPGQSLTCTTPFRVYLPSGRISRLGHLGKTYQITQWYPKPAVYDKEGWHPMPYLDQGEFYSEFGSFDVSINIPKDYVVAATGELTSGEELQWLHERAALYMDTSLLAQLGRPLSRDRKTIRFKQDKVHDFAWFADPTWMIKIDSVQLPHSQKWVESWSFRTPQQDQIWSDANTYLNDAIYYYSLWNGDYPYKSVAAIDGQLSAGAGMEYPMITIIGSTNSKKSLENVIVHEVGHNWFYGILGNNERDHPWLDEGLNTANEIRYYKTKYPNRDLLDLNSSLFDEIKAFFDLEGYDITDQNYLSYLFSARFGVDQAIETHSADFSQLNYGVIAYSKTGLVFEYLRHYWGDSLYNTAFQDYFEQWSFKHPQPDDLKNVLENASGEKLEWLFEDLVKSDEQVDYKIKSAQKGVVQIKNKTRLKVPFSITTINEKGEENQYWLPPVKGDTMFNVNDLSIIEARIDQPELLIEEFRHNNTWRSKGLIPTVEPLKMQFYGSLDRPEKTQIYWTPSANWNNYDKLLVGISFYNGTLPVKPFQWRIAPSYSFGENKITGAGNATITKYYDNGPFQFIRLGVYGRHYAYDTDLTYTRITTALNIQFRRPYPRSTFTHSVRLRNVSVWRELPTITDPPITVDLTNSNYSILDLRYRMENQHVLHPWQIFFDTQFATGFVKSYVDANFQWQIKPGSRLQWRNYIGWFIRNDFPSSGSYYNFGLSGTPDYLFDYYFLGRSEGDGFLSRQFFVADGGLKYDTKKTVNQFLASSTVQYPIWRFFQVYAEGAFTSNQFISSNGSSSSEDVFHYGAGFSLRFVPEFVELYFPVVYGNSQDGFQEGINPFVEFRFVLDLRLNEIYRRVTQGLY